MIYLRYQAKEIALRSPDLQNPEDFVLGVQRHFDMLGRPHTYIPSQNNTRIHTITMRAMTRGLMYDLRDFLIETAGKDIIYVDPYGTQWVGRIITDTNTIISNGDCKDYITLQFEGVSNA